MDSREGLGSYSIKWNYEIVSFPLNGCLEIPILSSVAGVFALSGTQEPVNNG